LNEDYAFCERARQAGHRIMVDTTVRLWHVGNYRYSWEDAGSDKQRFPHYHFTIGAADEPHSTVQSSVTNSFEFVDGSAIGSADQIVTSDPVWQSLSRDYPWPEERPPLPPNRTHGWLNEGTRTLLERALTPETRFVVEVGSWLGKSTRFILERAPRAGVIAIDHWRGSPEHQADPKTKRLIPRLFETFQVNCWESRQRLLPLRMPSVDGLRLLASRGLEPDVIYLDADHTYAAVKADLETCITLFPRTTIVGDDWDWKGVRLAVEEFVKSTPYILETEGAGWMISGKG